MELRIQDLLNNKVIHPAYAQILNYELKTLRDTRELSGEDYKESEIVFGLGLMKTRDIIEYLNSQPNNTITYSLRRKERDKVSLVHLVSSIKDAGDLSKHFTSAGMFPYHLENGVLEWAVKERDNTNETQLKAWTIKTAEVLGLDNIKDHKLRYLTSPQYGYEYAVFCEENRISHNPQSVHHPTVPHIASCYIIKGVLMKASDIYFDPKPKGIRVSYKILNDYMRDDMLYLSEPESKAFIEEVLVQSGQEGKARTRSPEVVDDVSIADLGGLGKYSGRVNLFRNIDKDAVCIRIVDMAKKAIPIEESIMSPSRKALMGNILESVQGIFLVCGSTGSGKSTTLGTCEEYMARIRPFDRIESVEDPIEQEVEEISQLSLENSGATYDDVAQALTRRNPNVIVLGEMNTSETVRFGINAAQQNLFLLSTLHTSGASKAPDRIRSMTISDPSAFEQFLSELRGILHQSMLKECCPKCTVPANIDDDRITEEMHVILKYYNHYDKGYVMLTDAKEDCPTCLGRGFLIDKPVICTEVIAIDDSLREDIRQCPPTEIETVLEAYMIDNHLTAVQDALEFMEEGKLSFLQIWRAFGLANKVSKARPIVNLQQSQTTKTRIID